MVLGLMVALEILDSTAVAGAFLGMAGVIGIAFGFAFRNIVANYLAGVLLSMRNPISTGDTVRIEDSIGKVIRLTGRDTVLMALDGNHVRIPNRMVIESVLTNYTRNPLRRLEFAVGVSVEQDLIAVRELGLKTLRSVPGVLSDPAPWSMVEELGGSTVNFRFYAWIDQAHTDFLKARGESIRCVKERFDEAGIEMAEPIYRVHMLRPGERLDQRPSPSPGPKGGADTAETSAERTIERQIAEVEQAETEEDLLKS